MNPSPRNTDRSTPRRLLPLATLGWALLASSGCGLLLGNVKPVDEKSDQYGVVDLAKAKPEVWTRLDPMQTADAGDQDPATTATEVSDIAFQAKKSPSVIAINSSCRPSVETQDLSLKKLTDQLLLGISGITQRTEKDLTIQGTPALETTVQGRMNGRDIALRTVVIRRKACVYDFLYMAPPASFSELEGDFGHFVASLRLK